MPRAAGRGTLTGENPRAPWRSIPLRVSLVTVMVLLVGLGLIGSGVMATRVLEYAMLERADEQLQTAVDAVVSNAIVISEPIQNGLGGDPAQEGQRFFGQYFVQRADMRTGQLIQQRSLDGSGPIIPPSNDVGSTPVNLYSASGDGARWRAVTVQSRGKLITVAVPLRDVDNAMRELARALFLIGAVITVVVAFLGWMIVRRTLRPLTTVERTARAIAAGDLSMRVPDYPIKTEVGQLAAALNGMLSQIQRAFAISAHSEGEARRSEENMRRFIADASHELRTPLTTVRGFAELHRHGATADVDATIAKIETEARRMGVLVEELLLLARLDERRPMAEVPVDLISVAGAAVDAARAVAPERTIEFAHTGDDDSAPVVSGDPDRLRQVVDNLVNNALRYTPPEAQIIVRARTEGPSAVIEVQDNGPGLSVADRQRVFERFYRADEARSRSEQGATSGSGLGLSIVSAIVAAHQGSVYADEAPGGGALFVVRLPQLESA